MMFITDDRCSMPMHTLMTDLVESRWVQDTKTVLVCVQVLRHCPISYSIDEVPVSMPA